jgi:hypothetical protein
MRRVGAVSVVVIAALCPLSFALTSAGAAPTAATHGNSVCRHTSYTGAGGYFSAGYFFWEPGDTVTIKVRWCSSGGAITSKTVTYTSAIPSNLDPRFTESDGLTRGGTVLKLTVSGEYESGVLNNSGFILLAGRVAANGQRHFADDTADEG